VVLRISENRPLRLVATSDWHGSLPASIPIGDVLIIAGDTLSLDHRLDAQQEQFESQLVPFLAELPHEQIVLVAGNHDFLFADSQSWLEELPDNVTYLLDEVVELGGVKIWGAPWSSFLAGWVFMEREPELAARWAGIPAETDVIVVHGPPFGSLDRTGPLFGEKSVGSRSLREWIELQQPQAVVCGHIHEGFGVDRIGRTAVYNVSYLDERYEHTPERDPVVIDIVARRVGADALSR
jgi:Icc-related predicted phosphoesterase